MLKLKSMMKLKTFGSQKAMTTSTQSVPVKIDQAAFFQRVGSACEFSPNGPAVYHRSDVVTWGNKDQPIQQFVNA